MEEEDEDEGNEPISDEPRKSSRERVPNKRFKDYELYITVAEEDEFLLATNGEESEEKEMESAMISDEGMNAVAHYIMVHYAKKELIKKRKKKYKPKDGQYTLDAGLRKFGDEGKTAVTNFSSSSFRCRASSFCCHASSFFLSSSSSFRCRTSSFFLSSSTFR